MVPPSASAKRPFLLATAPVNAPFTWPKSSDSSSDSGMRPQFYFRTTDVTGVVTLPQGTEMVMPGDNIGVAVELITPIALEKELRFAIREGGRTVGAGVVSEILA